MNRFKMIFNNANNVIPQNTEQLSSSEVKPVSIPSVKTNMPLNAPMIDRIHKAKPGCSACGKKVA